jgi:hypothetical protein
MQAETGVGEGGARKAERGTPESRTRSRRRLVPRLAAAALLATAMGCVSAPLAPAPQTPPQAPAQTPAQTPPDQAPDAAQIRQRYRETVARGHQANLERYKGNTDMFLRPGVLADRKAKRVVVQVQTTALNRNDPIEFFLITDTGGHDYEALAAALALPSDIYRALVFIGMEPGRGVDVDKLCFWPKGERVKMTFSPPGGNGSGPIAAEDLVLDRDRDKPLPPVGLVFVGGPVAPAGAGSTQMLYAIDSAGPGSVAATYNEPITLLDVPRQAAQSDVYGHLTVNPGVELPSLQLMEATLEPERKDGSKRVMDLVLEAAPRPASSNATVRDLVFRLRAAGDKTLGENLPLDQVLRTFSDLVKDSRDPCVTLQIADDMTLGLVRELCAVLASVETEDGIRMEPPPARHLYYKAFLPKDEMKDRNERIMQPWELRLAGPDTAPTGTLVRIEEVWRDERIRPDLKVTEHPVATPAALRERLDKLGPGLRVILVFARPSLTHGALMRFLDPALPTHPTVHVFLD